VTANETDLDLTEPVLICVLGSFRVVKAGEDVPVRSGGKTAILLSSLALRDDYRASRESLLEMLWPETEATRSAHSLNSLIHKLRQMLGDVLAGASPVIYNAGGYALNVSAGIGVDVSHFDAHAGMAEQQLRDGNIDAAVRSWRRAVELYHGEISVADDMRAIVQRERVRALYLSLLCRLADQYFRARDYQAALAYALRLLADDPCREDAHRLVMRCHVRTGERAQALRQYRVCEHILASEFEAPPEPLTNALFDRVRLDPAGV
jgi:DNA-binding SARP family transcriptional activator